MIPLRDRNPTRRTPVVTYGLIGACVAAFAIELSITAAGGDAALETFFERWAAVPADIVGALGRGDLASQAVLGMLTSMFLHAGWLHLLGNMLFLWIFGNNVEDRLGSIPFAVFYVAGGIAAALGQVLIDPQSQTPLVGASGAIAAALGAYIVLFPGARILSLVFLGFFYQLLEVPAIIVLGFWFALQLLNGVAALGAETAQGGVAFFAHIAGFAFGLVVGLLARILGAGARWRGQSAGSMG
ncbi:MAG TPA: rhomboid family intramembrane serine protease [Candidatus Limnocylindrales bacterium]|nr:rhomboid family intramembrane serine protease [Candidatus Limnocylindrales bacterium]